MLWIMGYAVLSENINNTIIVFKKCMKVRKV